jgi:uncharacterized protein (DUF58 family)
VSGPVTSPVSSPVTSPVVTPRTRPAVDPSATLTEFGRRLLAAPTAGGALTLMLGTVLTMIGLRAVNPWLLLVGGSLLTPVVLSQLLRPDLASVSICFSSPGRMVSGEWVEQTLHAHNRGRRSIPPFRLQHSHQGFHPVVVAVPALAPGEAAEVHVRRLAVRRGISVPHLMVLWSTAPFGMATHLRRFTTASRIVVQPAAGPVSALPAGPVGVRTGGSPARTGDDAHELREWRPGDALRQVHWRASARHDRLIVVIPESPVGARLALVVVGSSEDELWEELLSTAAWTVVDAVLGGRSVRVSAQGYRDCLGADADTVLDWFAGLGTVRPPSAQLLLEARNWAGGAGSVVAVTTRPQEWSQTGGVVVLAPTGQVIPA